MASITDRPRKRLSPKNRAERRRGHHRQRAQPPRPSRRRKQRLSREQRRQGGPQGRPEPTPAQAALRPAPRAGPHRLRAAGPGPDPAHLSAPRLAGPGRHPHRGRPHHRQLAPQPGRLGPGPPQQLSPRPLPSPLVLPPAGTPLHRRRLGSVRPRGPRRAGRRRHRHRTSRGQGLRQGLSPRPGPLHPLVHGLSLGAQVGRPGVAGPLPLLSPPLGLAADGGLVSARGEGDRWRLQAGAQDPGGSAGADAPHPDPLVPRPHVRLLCRRQLRGARIGRGGRGESRGG